MLRQHYNTGQERDLNLRALTHVEGLVLTNRYADAFVELSKLAEGLQSQAPFVQASALMNFAVTNADLLDDVVSFASDQHRNRPAIQKLPIETKLLALGQILALTGMRMQAEEAEAADLPAPTGMVH